MEDRFNIALESRASKEANVCLRMWNAIARREAALAAAFKQAAKPTARDGVGGDAFGYYSAFSGGIPPIGSHTNGSEATRRGSMLLPERLRTRSVM